MSRNCLKIHPNYIKEFAIKILNLKPHNASCKQIHSTLKWFSENWRGRLNVTCLESMAKIYSWYVINSKSELKYLSDELTEEEIKYIVHNMNQSDKYDEFLLDENNEILNEMNVLYSDILPEDQLDIDHIINLQYRLFNSQLQSTDTVVNNIHNNEFLGNKNFDVDEVMNEFDDNFFE
ncbi:3528_t:CDS:1 [Racocetra fulgida]|uniref:3528_t:CDS:1 n=1 Tax=Racocetra fulgida TaxID=60492 RepID=A0A9N9JEB9_9GLOM|nr:3528_t:CDS:1 [Racocetra fulgida]